VTAWRIIAAQTIDARIAGLIDSKAGLAARALDGSDQEIPSSADVQLEALAALLTDALRTSFEHGDAPGSRPRGFPGETLPEDQGPPSTHAGSTALTEAPLPAGT
jgi:hypothetical protein